jgi:Domain of unknown function (DUF6894)
VEELMPRFYFHLTSKDSHIPDDAGKELDSLNDAYEHAWPLIYKILFHVGDDAAKAWKVVITNEEHDAQITFHSLPHRLWLNVESPCGKFKARQRREAREHHCFLGNRCWKAMKMAMLRTDMTTKTESIVSIADASLR